MHDHKPCRGTSRRGFLLGAGAGLAAGLPLGWLGWSRLQSKQEGQTSPFIGRTQEVPRPDGMPGRFPGRVTEVRHAAATSPQHVVNQEIVAQMLDRGIRNFTGSDTARDAWRAFFDKDDVVGIKVNPVGRAKPNEPGRVPGSVGSISNPETVIEIVKALKEHVGLPTRNVIVFERYANEFRDAGYEAMMNCRDLQGARWCASASGYDESQLSIDGLNGGERDPHVVGYDPDVFVSMGFCDPSHSSRDDRRFRSHLSTIVSRMVNKVITIPCLKDHKSAGVTIALKNISHGMNNNVARSHISGIYRLDGSTSGPNQCNTFIPTAVAQPLIRQKMTLHIMDGLIGVYEGGPGNWNRSWGTWQRNSLFFSTDPVAMDHVGWDIIDARRAEEGWAPVSHMGQVQAGSNVHLPPRLAALAARGTPEAAALLLSEQQKLARFTRGTEPFDRRQPEHVVLAGLLGLGVFDAGRIEHRVVEMHA